MREQGRGHPLAGPNTLNRLALSTPETAPGDRDKKLAAAPDALARLLVEVCLEARHRPPGELWLDLDAMDAPWQGHQAGRFVQGNYRCYCYPLLYLFCGEHLLCGDAGFCR